MVKTMMIISMKLSRQGGSWSVILADKLDSKPQAYVLPRKDGETLADAAVRLEDIFRQLQEGGLKPLSVVNQL